MSSMFSCLAQLSVLETAEVHLLQADSLVGQAEPTAGTHPLCTETLLHSPSFQVKRDLQSVFKNLF